MPELTAKLRKELDLIQIKVLPEDYIFVRLPPDAKAIPGEWYRPATTRFAVFIRDPEEITLIVAQRKWMGMRNLFRKCRVSRKVRVVMLDLRRVKHPARCLPIIGRAFVEAGLATAPLASAHAVHVLVRRENLPKTIRVLRGLLSGEHGPGSPPARHRRPRA